MTMSLVISLLTLVLIAGALIWLRRRVNRALDSEEIMAELREEVNGLLREMNQTTERNVALVEDRITRLSELLRRADKSLQLLQREEEKSAVSREVYDNLRLQARRREAERQIDLPESDGSADEVPSLRERVLTLHRQGMAADVIASRVDAPQGEVELIISLHG